MNQLITVTGGCHCGAVRYQVQVEKLEAVECNCSICSKKCFIHLIVPDSRFTLLQGQDALSTYTFNTGIAKHHFCRHCGIHSFYRPRSHPDGYDVNLRCLDDDRIEQFQITSFDGRHWEEKVEQIRDRYS
jgi:hypothetical protein